MRLFSSQQRKTDTVDMSVIHKKNSIRLTQHLLCLALLLLVPALVCAKAPSWHSSLSFPKEMAIDAPSGLVIDQARKRYYVIDYNADQLVSFDEQGQLIDRFDAMGRLKKPVSMAFGAPGKMWVVQRSTNELLYIDLNSRDVRRFNVSKTSGQPMLIDRVATDDQQRLYVADSHSGRIFRLDDNLKITTIFAGKRDSHLIDFKIAGSTLYALDSQHQQLHSFTLDGQHKDTIALKGDLDRPVSFVLDSHGMIYILDRPQGKIAVFTAKGLFKYGFCHRGARRGQLNYPSELHMDWQDRLCVVNQGNDRIEVFKH